LWDTVDAYGLPIDELTEGVNRWLWPLSLPNCTLSEKVGKACHALSLDDERHTFHPVLWDECAESQLATHIKDERISQVWFAGVHANVGGGYPNDALSAVSLDWMCKEAQREGVKTKLPLVFLPNRLADWTDRRDSLGAVYDSRRGIAGNYRYNPRRIQHLTNGQDHERDGTHAGEEAPRRQQEAGHEERQGSAPEGHCLHHAPPRPHRGPFRTAPPRTGGARCSGRGGWPG